MYKNYIKIWRVLLLEHFVVCKSRICEEWVLFRAVNLRIWISLAADILVQKEIRNRKFATIVNYEIRKKIYGGF